MSKRDDKKSTTSREDLSQTDRAPTRRTALKKLGRFATVTAPTVSLLLAAQTKPGAAQSISQGCQAAPV
jgi:hypothetical protein